MRAHNTSDVRKAPEYSEPTIIHTETVTLTPGTNLNKTCTWNTTDTHPGAYSILVRAHLVPDEIDASDNTYIDGVAMLITPADLDTNGEVNIIDILIVAKAYSSQPEDDGWNPNADLDKNGFINIRDLYMVAKEFGKIYF